MMAQARWGRWDLHPTPNGDVSSTFPLFLSQSFLLQGALKTNIAAAMDVNVLEIAISTCSVLPPLLAAVVHESNALAGLFNSLRLLRAD